MNNSVPTSDNTEAYPARERAIGWAATKNDENGSQLAA